MIIFLEQVSEHDVPWNKWDVNRWDHLIGLDLSILFFLAKITVHRSVVISSPDRYTCFLVLTGNLVPVSPHNNPGTIPGFLPEISRDRSLFLPKYFGAGPSPFFCPKNVQSIFFLLLIKEIARILNFWNKIGLVVPHPLPAGTLQILTSGLHPALGLKPSGRMETRGQNFGSRPGGGAGLAQSSAMLLEPPLKTVLILHLDPGGCSDFRPRVSNLPEGFSPRAGLRPEGGNCCTRLVEV